MVSDDAEAQRGPPGSALGDIATVDGKPLTPWDRVDSVGAHMTSRTGRQMSPGYFRRTRSSSAAVMGRPLRFCHSSSAPATNSVRSRRLSCRCQSARSAARAGRFTFTSSCPCSSPPAEARPERLLGPPRARTGRIGHCVRQVPVITVLRAAREEIGGVRRTLPGDHLESTRCNGVSAGHSWAVPGWPWLSAAHRATSTRRWHHQLHRGRDS